MKKLLLFTAIFLAYNLGAQFSQIHAARDGYYSHINTMESNSGNEQAMLTMVPDTLHYFFLKHYFRNSTQTVAPSGFQENELFYTIPTPYSTTLQVDYCGAVFSNSTSITVNGL